MKPWDYDPELSEERLVKIAQLIARGRNDAVDRHDPTIGGSNWTRGVCAYSYACYQIEQAAGTHGFEWLALIDNGMQFQFRVGKVPMRFWRGDPSEPSVKISAPTAVEQLLLGLEPGIPTAGVLYRIGVVTDEDGSMLQAYFAALRSGTAETVWPITLTNATPLVVILDEDRPEGRELPPPAIGDRREEDSADGAGSRYGGDPLDQ